MIAQAMWDSYQPCLHTHSEQDAQVDQYLYDDIESPCATRLLGNENNSTDSYTGIDIGDDNGEGDDVEGYNEGYNSDDYAGKEYGGVGDTGEGDEGEGHAVESM